MHLHAAPAWTFKGKKEEKVAFNPPGPGNYDPSTKSLSKFDSAPTYRIGTSSRDHFVGSKVPGPGAYTASEIRPHSSATKIGTGKRLPLNENVETPGPGTYEIPAKAVEGPKFTMVGRGLTGNSSNSPGPGHYEHELNDITAKERAPTYRIGSASRTERPNSGYVPGPGNYETRGKEIGPK